MSLTDKILLFIYTKVDRRIKSSLLLKIRNCSGYTFKVKENFKFDIIKSHLEIHSGSHIEIEKDVIFRDFCNVMVYPNAKLKLGKYVFFNRYCSINCLGEIEVGDYTIFGEGVKLYDHNHLYNDVNKIIQQEGCSIGKIVIGRNCWVGANVTILNNVTIGDNVVIGANNLIYNSIPSGVVIKNRVDQIVTKR